MRATYGAFLLLAFSLVSVAGAAPPDAPIRLPESAPIPQPMPGPIQPIRLTVDSLFVIDSDVPCIVIASPLGLVTVAEEAGPLKIRGRFVDGTGVETRTFKGKSVFTIEAVGTGRVELLVIPVGAAKPGDVIRRTVDVDAGHAPQPPPPKPVPVPGVAVAWIVCVEESSQRTADTAKVLGDLAYWQGLEKRTPKIQWRVYDKDSPEAKQKNYDAFGAELGLPAVLLLAADGKKIGGFRLPKTVAEIDAKLKELAP